MAETEQLFVAVQGYLRLANTVDSEGNPTDQTPLLQKLINAPPPLTKEEAAKLLQDAADAKARELETQKQAELVEADAKKAMEASKAAEEELKKKTTQLDAKHREAMAKVRDTSKTLQDKEKALDTQKQDLEKQAAKAQAQAEAEVNKLKRELQTVKATMQQKIKDADAEKDRKVEKDRKAAEELARLAQDEVAQLRQRIADLEREYPAAPPVAPISNSPLLSSDYGDVTSALPSSRQLNAKDRPPMMESLGSSAEQDLDPFELDKLLKEHDSWKANLMRRKKQELSTAQRQVAAEAGMPEGRVSVIQQRLGLPGKELFPGRGHYVKAPEEERLYTAAMRTKDRAQKAHILRRLDEKHGPRLTSRVDYKPKQVMTEVVTVERHMEPAVDNNFSALEREARLYQARQAAKQGHEHRSNWFMCRSCCPTPPTPPTKR